MNNQQTDMAKIVFEVRALLSLLLQQHVRSWYTGLTQDEEVFKEFTNLTTQIGHGLTGRVQSVNWSCVFKQDLPAIVLRHLEDINIARDRARVNSTTEQAFRLLQDHAAAYDQDTYLMHVADALLIVLLPEEHLMSEVAYCFSRELLSDLILKTIIERLSEPWFWDEIILKMCRVVEQHVSQSSNDWQSQLKVFWQSSTFRQHEVHSTLYSTSHGPGHTGKAVQESQTTSIGSIFRRCKLFCATLYTRPSLYNTSLPLILYELSRPTKWPFLKPFAYKVLLPVVDLVAGPKLLRLLDTRLELGISHSSLAKLVSLARSILFPNDLPSASKAIPTSEQQAKLRSEVKASLPEGLVIPFFESRIINKILVCKILDYLIGQIFPELKKRSPEQLKEKVVRIRQANFEAAGSGGISTGRVHYNAMSTSIDESQSQELMNESITVLQQFEAAQEACGRAEMIRGLSLNGPQVEFSQGHREN